VNINDELFASLMKDLSAPLPRQGPGSPETTRRAFALLGRLPEQPKVLDMGCGTGAQTMELAKLMPGHIIGLDVFGWALDGLAKKVEEAGLIGRVHTIQQSMDAMEFPDETFDLIWSEGALYIMGFENALKACGKLLKPGGYLAASEASWFSDDPPEELREFWMEGYPDIQTVDENMQLIVDCGYEVLGHFHLPDAAWWDDYYTPMLKLLPQLREKYAEVPDALAMLDENETEMEMHRKYSAFYGYEFFVCRRSN
jgi:ubiquinone/menaquinone biosynthesis C-methylase UbiE